MVGIQYHPPTEEGRRGSGHSFLEDRAGGAGDQGQSTPEHRGLCPQGLGTKEGVIIEILASRTKNQLREIMKAYEEGKGLQRWWGGNLDMAYVLAT
jgi:hypothetical protein